MTTRLAVASICLCFVTMTAAFAYIDPNSGGLIFQMLAPVFAVIVTIWILAKEKAARMLGRMFRFLMSARGKKND